MLSGDQEGMIGKWAVCSIGRIGIIEGRKELDWGLSWIGTGIDGKPWASRKPRLVCDADAERLEELRHAVAGP